MYEFHVLTIFPEMFASFMGASICKRALDAGKIDISLHNFREYTLDKHKRVDDAPFSGGAGMLIGPQSVFDCFAAVQQRQKGNFRNIYLSPSGKPLTAEMVQKLAQYDGLNLLCGHYEGVDQRILDCLIDEEISIGDYILTGGELPAMVLMDAVMRHVPGVLGNCESAKEESFANGLLEYPQYTRPAEFRGMKVPEVLLNGNHAHIMAWRRKMAIEKTARMRPDLLCKADLTDQEKKILQSEKEI